MELEQIGKNILEIKVAVGQQCTDLKYLRKAFDKASSAEGFPRCAARGERILFLERSAKWIERSIFGGVTIYVCIAILERLLA